MTVKLKDKLKKHRQEKGLSLDELARVTNTSKSYLWELENRDQRKPSAKKLTDIAAALSVTTDYLLDEEAELDDEQLKEVFFRKFNRLDSGDKERVKEMIEAWGKKK